MENVDRELTEKIALLARLELKDEEIENYTKQLDRILGYVQQISEVDTENVESLFNPHDHTLRFREDVKSERLLDKDGEPKILQSAPETQDRGIKVPPIL